MGADVNRSYFMHCRYWQTMDMSWKPEVEDIIYPLIHFMELVQRRCFPGTGFLQLLSAGK
jgi:hypothetical protein